MTPWPYRQQSPGAASPSSGDPSRPRPSTIDPEIPTLHARKTPPQAPVSKHSRSFSHPFPSLFRGGSKRSDKRGSKGQGYAESTDDEDSVRGLRAEEPSKIPSRHASIHTQSEPVNGSCMTCNSTVRWPRDLKVFRCTVCATVNDLEPNTDIRAQMSNAPPELQPSRRAVPLSLDRTRAMVDQCLHAYLDGRRRQALVATDGPSDLPSPLSQSDEKHWLQPPPRDDLPNAPEPSMPLRPALQMNRSNSQLRTSGAALATRIMTSPENQSRLAQENEVLDGDTPKSRATRDNIFRPVENYIISCMAECATLNRAFLTVRPDFQRAASEGASHVLDSPRADASLGKKLSTGVEVDAKTLLLGDIAENGAWWTGDRPSRDQSSRANARERSPNSWRGVVNLKSPRINWIEVTAWYRCIMTAGENWRSKWEGLLQPSSPLSPNGLESEPLLEVESDLLESRNRLQRVLLKATENLLKRPGRPLNHPEDCRFLLIILVNPLLGSPLSGSSLRRSDSHNARRGPGQHSGIIKRTLGLIAKLPDDIQQFFVSWFSRLPEGQFPRLVELIGGFVTYRLSRPSQVREFVNPTEGLVPSLSDGGVQHASQVHAAIGGSRSQSSRTSTSGKPQLSNYGEDWQIRAAARVMGMFFAANGGHTMKKRDTTASDPKSHSSGLTPKHKAHLNGQLIPISNFYNTMLDYADLGSDFDRWEANRGKFSFCQYPFFLSIYAKIHLMELEARRQMASKARQAFFDTILTNKAVSQFLVLKVRRDCLVEDSLRGISEVVGTGQDDIKKGLKIDFVGEEGIDAGGLRKEWFLLLIREVFDEAYGLFVYDEDSRYCYFNPHCFESSEQYFLVGVVTGLAIYNSTILDIAFPPFVFKKLLSSTPANGNLTIAAPRITGGYTLEDLAELRPSLARGLRQLLDFEGDVQEAFCRDFVIEDERYGEKTTVPLCPGGEKIPVTNSNRLEFVRLYIHHLLDSSMSRQYEPFKRGFFTVCGGNALSLFRPQEIELLIRGSDEPLDIKSLRAVAVYEGVSKGIVGRLTASTLQVAWFWETFERATPLSQRKLLSFITGSDRIPAMGATNLVIKIQLLQNVESGNGKESGFRDGNERFPTARTCFNTLVLHPYRSREILENKLWVAVEESEGFGLK